MTSTATPTLQPTTQPRFTTNQLTGAATLAGPALLTGYGIIRLMDGTHGPGPGWAGGHILLLLALASYVPVLLRLRRLAAGHGPALRIATTTGTVLGLLGTAAGLGQAAVDLYVGTVSSDRAAMNSRFDAFQSHPGVTPLLYSVVPVLFYVGLLTCTTALALARPRPVTPAAPVLVLLGTVAMATSLDLLPLGGLLFATALAPLAIALLRRPTPAARG